EKTLAIRRELKAWKTDPSLRRVRRETVALDQEAERLANQAETAIEANRGHGKDLFTPCMDLCRRAEERLNQTKIAEALQESKARFEVLSRETDGTAEALQESQEKLHQIEREAGAILKQTTPTGETTEAAPGTLEAEIEALSLRFDPLRTRVRESLDQAIRIRSDADHLSTDLGRDREGALRAANDARHEAGALLDQAVAEWRRVLTVAEKLATDADAGEEQVRLLLKGLQTRHEKLRETVIALHRAARGRLWKRLATVGAIALILGSAWWWIYRNRAHARRVANVAQQVEESLRSDNLSGALERVLGSGLDPADQRDFTNALAQALEFPDIGVQELLPGQTRRVKLEPQPPTTSRFRKALRNVTWTVPAYLSHNSVTVEATRTNFTCADPNGLELTLTAGLRSEVSIGRTNSFQLPVTNALVPDGALTIRFQVTENVPPTITVREDDARDRTALTDYQTLKRTAPASLRLAVSVEDKTLPKETNASVIDGRWRLPPRLTADHIMANTATSLVLTNLPPGTYSLELQATDGALTSTFHLTVEVAESGDQLAVRAFDDAKAAAGRDSFDEARAKLRNISDLDSLREDIRSNVTAWLRDLESPPELLNDTLSLPYGATTNLMEYIRDNLRDQTALGRTSWSITPLDPPDSDPSNYRARTNVELSFQLRFAPNWAKTTNRSLSIKVTPTATEESLKEALERLRDPRESAAEVYRALLGLTSDAMREEEAARLSTTLAVFANLQLEGPDSVDVLAGETGSVELAVSQWPFNALPPAWRLALTPNTPSNGPQAKEMTVTYTPPPESGDVEVSVEVVAIEAGAEDVTPRLQTQPRPLRFKVGMNQPPEIEDLPKSAETTESTWTRKFRAHDPEDHPLQWPAMSANVKVTNAPSGEGYEVTVERIQPGTNTVFLTASDGVRTNRFTIEIMRILGEPLGGDFGLQWVPDLPNSNGVWPGEKVKGGWMATNWITVSQLDRPSLDSPEVPPEPAECTKEKAEEYVKQISVAAEAGLPGGWKVIIATKDQLKQEENNLPLGKYFWARDTTELQIFHLFGGKIIPGTDLTQAQQLGRFRIAVVHP
ncbi:MAG: hypothetical protein H7A45_19820, partial [Verrucomicrobiales bacterium]|nr:hypothetical protein [Verrucomicrobiales bacterium]